MRVSVYWIGKPRLPGASALTEEYCRRIGRFCDFHAQEIRAPRGRAQGTADEEAAFLSKTEGLIRVVLDPAGKTWTSPELAEYVGKVRDGGARGVAFLVGGADGFTEPFLKQADLKLSLSPLTLPHELARVVLLEQIYRAFAILSHHPYPR